MSGNTPGRPKTSVVKKASHPLPRDRPLIVHGKYDVESQRYIIFTKSNKPGTAVDQDFKQTTQTKQPPKTATTQKEGVKKTSDAVTSVTGDGPSQRALIPRTKSGEHRLLHPGREPPTQGSIPSPPTAPPMPQRHRRRSSQTTHET